MEDLSDAAQKKRLGIKKGCAACGLNQGSHRRSLFCIRRPVVDKFNNQVQVYIVKITYGNIFTSVI